MNKLKLKVGAIALLCGIFAYSNMNKVSAVTSPNTAPFNWAFEESSIPLHDAILASYPTIDANNDGYINVTEANSKTGSIDVRGKSLTGTINGIEHFKNIQNLVLENNKFSGQLPLNIGGLENLINLYASGNNFEGVIPDSIWNLTNIKVLNISVNENLSGNISSEISNLIHLENFNIAVTSIDGVIPNELYTLPMLKQLNLLNVKEISGNPKIGFQNSTTLMYLDIRGTGLIQARPILTSLTKFYSDDLASSLLNNQDNDLGINIDQSNIDKAEETTLYLEEPAKSEWQVKINLAQKILNAKNDVAAIFTDNTKDDVVSDITKEELKTIKEQVNLLPNGPLKDSLNADVIIAENILNAKDQIDTIFGGDTDKKTTKPGLTQTDIDNAKEAVDLLEDGPLRDQLLADITNIENIFKNDINKDGLPDLNIDIDGNGTPDLNITDGDGNVVINIVTDGNGNLRIPVNITDTPDVNIDTDQNGFPDLNIDIDGDLLPDINLVVDENGNLKKPVLNTDVPNVNIDTNGDGNPDANIDVNGDLKPDVNIDTDEDGTIDKNEIQDTDKNKPNYVEPGTTNPIYNVDTDNDGKADYNLAYDALNTTEALAILAKIDVLNRKLYTKVSLDAMDAKIPTVNDILSNNGISRALTIEAHADQASLDIAVADLVKAYNGLVLLTNDKTNIAQTGVNAPVVGIVLMISSLGSIMVLKRKIN